MGEFGALYIQMASNTDSIRIKDLYDWFTADGDHDLISSIEATKEPKHRIFAEMNGTTHDADLLEDCKENWDELIAEVRELIQSELDQGREFAS